MEQPARQPTQPIADAQERTLYLDIARELRRRIRDHYDPGDPLPSERMLAAEFGVHRNTIRRSLEELSRGGIIATRWGGRSTVARKRLSHRVAIHASFTASALAAGLEPRTQLVAVSEVPSRDARQICEKLVAERPSGEVTTIRYLGDDPVCWIRQLLFGIDIRVVMAGFPGGSVQDFIRGRTGIVPQRQESIIGADRASSIDCRMLRIPRGASVLYASSLNIDPSTGAAVEVSITRFRGDVAELRMKL